MTATILTNTDARNDDDGNFRCGLDLTPHPIPSYDHILASVDRLGVFLSSLAAEDEGECAAIAARLLEPDAMTGQPRIYRLAQTSYNYAYQVGDGDEDAIRAFASDLVAIIYDLAEHNADLDYPLRFEKPDDFVITLEIADARRRFGDDPDRVFSSRQLARLARVDESTINALLYIEQIPPQPYGVSLRELAEMDIGEANYWYGQNWVLDLDDLPAWIARMPGFIPTRAGTVEITS